jgi:hypothetical protein
MLSVPSATLALAAWEAAAGAAPAVRSAMASAPAPMAVCRLLRTFAEVVCEVTLDLLVLAIHFESNTDAAITGRRYRLVR